MEESDHANGVCQLITEVYPASGFLYHSDVFLGDEDMADGIEEACENNVHLLNLSIGLSTPISEPFKAALRRAKQQGIGIIVAAGNEGKPFENSPFHKSLAEFALREMEGHLLFVVGTQYTPEGKEIKYEEGNTPSFAAPITLAAPAVNILVQSTLPEGEDVSKGTSLSTAIVTGAAARLKSQSPTFSIKEIFQLLREGARKTYLGTNTRLPSAVFGQGVLDFEKTMRLSLEKRVNMGYKLIVTHRTQGTAPCVRLYDPERKDYMTLGTLPECSTFTTTTFDLLGWNARAMLDLKGSPTALTKERSFISFINGKSDIHSVTLMANGSRLKEVMLGDLTSESQVGVHVYSPEKDKNANEWSEAQRFMSYRTTGAQSQAKHKHSAIAFQLLNKEINSSTIYKLIVNHRTQRTAPCVRLYDPERKDYMTLGTLPECSTFTTTTFDLLGWNARAMLDAKGSPTTLTKARSFLSFINGKSDIHSVTLMANGSRLREVILGDLTSESQPGIHVYSPEKDHSANEWSQRLKEQCPTGRRGHNLKLKTNTQLLPSNCLTRM